MSDFLLFFPSFPFSRGYGWFLEGLPALWCLDQISATDMAREAIRAHTVLLWGILLAGGERGVCTCWICVFFDKDCL